MWIILWVSEAIQVVHSVNIRHIFVAHSCRSVFFAASVLHGVIIVHTVCTV